MTLFTLIGARFVERTYVESYGEDYRRVQADKPLMIPNPLLALRPSPDYHASPTPDGGSSPA